MSKEAANEKKEIENVHKFQPSDFNYCKILGEGAFGIVRKCELTFEAANASASTSEGSNDSEGDEPLKTRFPDKETRVMAVKMQSKYQLIKSKQ